MQAKRKLYYLEEETTLHPMRRTKNALNNEGTLQILNDGLYGILSTCGEDGPYGVPVNYAFSQGEIFFHCAPQGHKLLNLEHDPRVSFTVVQSAAVAPNNTCLYSSAIAFGTAERLGDPSRILPALQLLLSKYYGDQGRVDAVEDGLRVRIWEDGKPEPYYNQTLSFRQFLVYSIKCQYISGKSNVNT